MEDAMDLCFFPCPALPSSFFLLSFFRFKNTFTRAPWRQAKRGWAEYNCLLPSTLKDSLGCTGSNHGPIGKLK